MASEVSEPRETTDEQFAHTGKQQSNSKRCCHVCVRCMSTGSNPLPENATLSQRCLFAVRCPPHGVLATGLTVLAVMVLIWASAWGILKTDALPGGNIFALLVMTIAGLAAGAIMEKIKMPSLLGMLLVGFALRNIPHINIARDIRPDWSFTLRLMALTVILLRAGLGLDVAKLRALSWAVVRLSVLPCAVEVVSVAMLTRLLFTFPWSWAFMLGFVHAAVSPAVVVPCMLELQEKGLGINKAIPTLLIAAGSIENVLAISGFSLVVGLTFTQGSLVLSILRAPMEIIVGTLFGLVAGIFCWYIPERSHVRLVGYRFIILFTGGMFAMFGFRAVGLSGSGALASLILPFVAAQGWKRRGWPNGENPLPKLVGNVWFIFQPLLFGLIGAEVKISDLKGDTLGWGSLIMVVALTLRSIATFLSSFRVKLKHKEKFFIALAWIPKATVQAAIGSIALDTAKENGLSEEHIEMGTKILTIAVFLIVVTAPIGAILITASSTRLLHKTEAADDVMLEEVQEKLCANEQNASLNKDEPCTRPPQPDPADHKSVGISDTLDI